MEGLTRVGEESLIESTQELVLPSVSVFFENIFRDIVKYPSGAAGNSFGTKGENRDLDRAIEMVIPIPFLASGTTTFWFVISVCIN